MTQDCPDSVLGPASPAGTIPGTGEAAFALFDQKARIPVLVAAPHAGRRYPKDLLDRMRDPELATLKLEDRLVDLVARDIAARTGAALLLAHAPRAMLDLNRARDDMDWGMVRGSSPRRPAHSQTTRRSRGGLGLVPRFLPGFGEIWRGLMDADDLNQRVSGIHTPYHRVLAQTLEKLRDRWGAALLIDLHSMPPLRQPVSGRKPPEIVLGDRFGAACDPALMVRALSFFAGQGREVSHNRPYAGGYILERHAAPLRGIHAMQIELCRSTYLDARLEQPSARLPAMGRLIAEAVTALVDELARLRRPDELPEAAE